MAVEIIVLLKNN